MTTILYTVHAQRTMGERGITREEVAAAVLTPDVSYRNRVDRPDYQVRQKGDVAVVVKPDEEEPDGLLVITVLWRQNAQWTNDEARNRGREEGSR